MSLYSIVIGEGKPFLILHGFLGMSDNWKSQGKRFSQLGYQVHLIDQRNHGRSFHDEEFNYDVLAVDLKAYCDEHKLKDFILLGHSMGGKTAMLFAAIHSEYIDKLIINDISPRFYPVHHDRILEGLNALDLDSITARSQADEFLSQYVPEVALKQFLLKNLYWKEKGQLALRLNLEALTENVGEVGEALPWQLIVDVETLFMRGDRSEYISDDDIELIHAQFPNSRLVTIPEAGHWLHADNPEVFFDEIKRFLND
ncbi:MAG: alpha/beta fold hydrolase [Bacteroidia bacterium]|nr:alpha/beta fold hydrolase [Bacteroidia bacterium]MBT8268721.1 alpha/beta fold hydrolase [Bacteroidia bacterium]NNF81557.1 alpha/beta fold hydrolase [Flavobacteriaceae bacterium]NNK69719.1 alpha/beta fold hydrolase [Flavobacteriaceae bacterium]NNL81272.1 alpha/beta fold hydrolase [Flavobacteriaceae bacterium]